MKRLILFFIGVLLTQQGCALLPSQLSLSKPPHVSHKAKATKEHKLAKQHKTKESNSALKERITLVDFNFFDKDQHKSKSHHKKKQNVAATGTVGTSFYPVGFQLIKIPQQGIALEFFLVKNEVDIAILATQEIIRNKVNTETTTQAAAEKLANEEKEKIASVADLHPDVIVLQRGGITTMFPRGLLVIPQVANLKVLPNDVVYTLDIDQHNLTTRKSSFLTNRSDLDRDFTLTGFTKQSRVIETKPGLGTVDQATKKYSREFQQNVPAVTVVYRYYEGQLFRFLVPNEYYGAFSKPKNVPKGAANEKAVNAAQKKWDDYFKTFSIMAIQDGDVIEFTTLDLLDLTSPLNAVLKVR